MESDGLAIHRCIGGDFNRNSRRHPGHPRVVPIRTIAGRSAPGFLIICKLLSSQHQALSALRP
jgi:hypothetical protein